MSLSNDANVKTKVKDGMRLIKEECERKHKRNLRMINWMLGFGLVLIACMYTVHLYFVIRLVNKTFKDEKDYCNVKEYFQHKIGK